MDVLTMIVSSTMRASGACWASWSKAAWEMDCMRQSVMANARKLRGRCRKKSVVPMIADGPKSNRLHEEDKTNDTVNLAGKRHMGVFGHMLAGTSGQMLAGAFGQMLA